MEYLNCGDVNNYQILSQIGNGTYGEVYLAKDTLTNSSVALKKFKCDLRNEGFSPSILREISTVSELNHFNIVNMSNVCWDQQNAFLALESMPHDLSAYLQKHSPLPVYLVKKFIKQILSGLNHMHNNRLMHRDLKPNNILVTSNLDIKISDFGLAREFKSKPSPYTPVVQTLWYRAPEVLLGAFKYSEKVDMWSVGCIFAELLRGQPVFAGCSCIDQLWKIFRVLGTPSPEEWPQVASCSFYSQDFPFFERVNLEALFPELDSIGLDLMCKLLTYNPALRIDSASALKHPFLI
mmetsp:Transcript_1654/g.2687  ORF Transcript_1654/g.2687 Transcript_1654/m.2687 type:complete len:294 (+) Transcript_1654:725-1606(+)